jgi:hypothetical protein
MKKWEYFETDKEIILETGKKFLKVGAKEQKINLI